jgi:putative hydrolase of the HAD superfamily
MIKCVLFDLDGTLYNERDFVISGFRVVSEYLSRTYGIDKKKCFAILRNDFDRGLRSNNFDVLIDRLELDIGIQELVEVYRQHQPNINLFPDAETILSKLRDSLLLGLVTDGWREVQQRKVSALKVEGRFDIITFTDAYGRENWKPSLRPFEITLKKLGVEAKESMYVADNPVKDFIGAKKLGITTVRIRRGGGEYDSIESDAEHEADYNITSLLELQELIEKINAQKDH